MKKIKILILERDNRLRRTYSIGIERYLNKDETNYELELIEKPEEIKKEYDIYLIDITYVRELEEFIKKTKNNNNYFIMMGKPFSDDSKEISKNYDEIISKEDIFICLENRLK